MPTMKIGLLLGDRSNRLNPVKNAGVNVSISASMASEKPSGSKGRSEDPSSLPARNVRESLFVTAETVEVMGERQH